MQTRYRLQPEIHEAIDCMKKPCKPFESHNYCHRCPGNRTHGPRVKVVQRAPWTQKATSFFVAVQKHYRLSVMLLDFMKEPFWSQSYCLAWESNPRASNLSHRASNCVSQNSIPRSRPDSPRFLVLWSAWRSLVSLFNLKAITSPGNRAHGPRIEVTGLESKSPGSKLRVSKAHSSKPTRELARQTI